MIRKYHRENTTTTKKKKRRKKKEEINEPCYKCRTTLYIRRQEPFNLKDEERKQKTHQCN